MALQPLLASIAETITPTTTQIINLTTTSTTTLPSWYRTCSVDSERGPLDPVSASQNSIRTIELALRINCVSFLVLALAFTLIFFCGPFARALAPRGGECKSLLDWLRPLWWVRYQEGQGQQGPALEPGEGIGLDGQMLIRFCVLGFRFCAVGSLVSGALLPIYSRNYNGDKAGTDNFEQFTASSLVRTGYMWVLVLASYVLTGTFLMLARLEWKKYLVLRREHFWRRATGRAPYEGAAQAQYSVLVEQVPPSMQDPDALLAAFRSLFPSVLHCVLMEDTRKLHMQKTLGKTAGALRCFCCHHRAKARYKEGLRRAASLEQEFRHNVRRAHEMVEYGGKVSFSTSTAIVTFGSVKDCLIAQQTLLFKSDDTATAQHAWRLFPAPEPRDIVWVNMSSMLPHVVLRTRICTFMWTLGVLFANAPILALQFATNPENVKEYAPSLDKWARNNDSENVRYIYRVACNYLPVLMTFAIWLVPPTVVECVSHSFERRKTRSAVAGSALYRNFSFQIASLYLLAVGGVIWYSVRDILASPLCAGQILGATVPKVAVYFMVFVIARIGITLPMLLLRLYGLWQGVRQLTGASPEQQEEEPCWWSYEGTNIAIVLVLANMYSVIAPWIMPLCAVYFAVASAVYRWLFKNVYAPEFDGAGQCWIGLFNTAMVGLFAGSLTLCGIVALDGVLTVQFFATWLLPVLIGLFQVRYNDVYGRLAEVMPLELAIEVDRNEGPLVVEKFDPNLYKDPMLLAFDPEETSMSTSSGSSSDDDES